MKIDATCVAAVTGAAGGIGLALSRGLSVRGAAVAMVDINEAALAESAKSIGGRVSAHAADVSKREDMFRIASEVGAAWGPANLVINNAGVSVAAPVQEMKLEDFEWLMGVNFWGIVHGCKAFLPQVIETAPSAIVNILSDFGLMGFPTKSAYCSSKFAGRGFTLALRAELHGTGVRVHEVYPPAVNTGIIRASRVWDAAKAEIESAFVEQRGIAVDKVAERILRGIERGNERIRIGRDTAAIDWATRLMPYTTQRLLGRFKGRVPFV